jgi:uncharacterized protein (DUF934 family)
MSVIVTDRGFVPAEPLPEAVGAGDLPAAGAVLALATDTVPEDLAGKLDGLALIRVDVGHFADGRGFSLARALRRMGYRGRLRARGHVLADQYAMARRAGFDEVEIDDALARRQPEADWLARAGWQAHDYRARLGYRQPAST